TELYHHSSTPDTVYETGVAATAINDEFGYWKKELLKSSPSAHAIIHDKIVVIDPLSATECVVITGSHNDGYKASYADQQNLRILRGNGPLARAYATHVMDIYDHYRWRYIVQKEKQHAWTGLQTTPTWQDKYFQPGNAACQEIQFWLSASADSAQPTLESPNSDLVPGETESDSVGPLQVPVHRSPAAHPTTHKRRTNGESRHRGKTND